MKNLFSFATKELSQDAFLRWLFESWDDSDIAPCVEKLIEEFCGTKAPIQSIATIPQMGKIDVTVEVLFLNGESVALFLEDKTFSALHDDQLNKYNHTIEEYLKKHNGRKACKIFYQTARICLEDYESTNAAGWKPYDIQELYNIFKPFSNTKNVILKQYIEYLEIQNIAFNNKDLPISNHKNDFQSWQSCFINLIPKLDNRLRWVVRIENQSQTVCLKGYRKDKVHAAYIEVRSNECKYDVNTGKYQFRAVILCYDIDSKVVDSNREHIMQAIQNDTCFTSKNHKQQIGQSKQMHTVSDTNELIAILNKHVESYWRILDSWNDN